MIIIMLELCYKQKVICYDLSLSVGIRRQPSIG